MQGRMQGSRTPALEAQRAAGVVEADVAIGRGAHLAQAPLWKGPQLGKVLQRSRLLCCLSFWVV